MRILITNALCLGCFLVGSVSGMNQTADNPKKLSSKDFQGMHRQRMSSEFWRKTADSLKKDVNKAKNAISEKIKNIRNRNSSSQNDSLEDSPVHLNMDTISSISDDEEQEFDIEQIPGVEILSENSYPNSDEKIIDEILSENFSLGSEEENPTETLEEESINETVSESLDQNHEEGNLNEIHNEESEQSNETENQAAELVDPAPVVIQDNQLTALKTQLQQLNRNLEDLRNREFIEINTFNSIENQKFAALDALSNSNQYKKANGEQRQAMEIDFKNQWLNSDEQERARWNYIQSLRQQQSEILSRIAEVQALINSLQNQ